jgi:hypothetical protein
MKAGGPPFPADHQAAVLAVELGTRSLSLIARDHLFDRPSPRLAAFPDTLGDPGAKTTVAEAPAKIVGSRPILRGQHLEALARSALLPRAHAQGVQQRDDLGALVTIGRPGAYRQRHAGGVREGMDEHTFAFPAMRDPFTAAFARGKTSRPRRRTATESGRVLPRAQAGALAWQPASRRPANTAATGVRRSWTPIAGRGGGRTSGSR